MVVHGYEEYEVVSQCVSYFRGSSMKGAAAKYIKVEHLRFYMIDASDSITDSL